MAVDEVDGETPKWLDKTDNAKSKMMLDLVDCIDISNPNQEPYILPVGRGRGRPKYSLKALTIPLLQEDANNLNSNITKSSSGSRSRGRGRRLKCGKNVVSQTEVMAETIIGVMRTENATFTEEFPELGASNSSSKSQKSRIVPSKAVDTQFEDAVPDVKLDLFRTKDLKKLTPRDCYLLLDELPCHTKEKDVTSRFQSYGEVCSCQMQHEEGLVLLQRAVVCMNSKKSCDKAFSGLRGTSFMGSESNLSIQKLSEFIRREDDPRFFLFK